MTATKRRFIFYSLVFLFIITGIGVVFYSQGWRPVFGDNKIVFQKTGAIFIETAPKGVLIKIGEEIFKEKIGLMQSGTLINNLLPKNYKIEIKKEGYALWEKNISVKSGLVSQISKAVLIPENPEKNLIPLAKSIDAFWMSSDGKIVFSAKGGSASGGKNESNLYFEPQNSSTTKLRGDKFIAWSDDNDKIITQDSKTEIYYLYGLNNLSQSFNITAAINNLQKIAVKQIAFHPLDSNRLIIQGKDNFLYILDTSRLNLENIVKDPILAWTIKSPNIYYIKQSEDLKLKTKSYTLASFNLIMKTENFSFELPVQLTNQKISKISISNNKIVFLSDNGALYLFNQQNKDFKQIAHSAGNFEIYSDSKKIAFGDKNGKLNVYFIEDYQDGIAKKAGDVISFGFYLKSSGKTIKNIFWYKDSSHLFIDYIDADKSGKTDFLEVDDRQPINKYTLVKIASGFNYLADFNRLYFVQNNTPYFVEL